MTPEYQDAAINPLIRYDAMVSAIAECRTVDEAKDIRDKARALEAYYRQANNLDAERQCCEVRLRAEREAGKLASELERGQGARNDLATSSHDATKSPYAQMLERTGASRQTIARYQELAAVPQAEFDAQLARIEMPSASRILAAARAAAQMFPYDPTSLCRMEWQGMPEYVSEDLTPVRSILVHFASPGDVAQFEGLVGQSIGKTQRWLWFPAADIMRMADKRYVAQRSGLRTRAGVIDRAEKVIGRIGPSAEPGRAA